MPSRLINDRESPIEMIPLATASVFQLAGGRRDHYTSRAENHLVHQGQIDNAFTASRRGAFLEDGTLNAEALKHDRYN